MDRPALIELLREARSLIHLREDWIARGYGANAEGQWRPIGSPDATRFTLQGAIIRATRGSRETLTVLRTLLTRVAPELAARLSSDADVLTHEESLRVLDLAIESLEGAPVYIPKNSGVVPRAGAAPTDTSLQGLVEAATGTVRKR
jgi:hypothetical protein